MESLSRLQKYLQIKTNHPDPDYETAIDYLGGIGEELGLQKTICWVHTNKPVLVLTAVGQNPSLPSVLLNSHMDVVPAFAEHWKFDPFGGCIDADGKIYGRGVQDMKSVGMQYLEAMRKLMAMDKKLERTIHISFVPDEELGGKLGMAKFVETEDFRRLNVGVCLDEGVASANDEYHVYYAERSVWWIDVVASGSTGHGSKFIENTAAEKLYYVIGKMMEMRNQEKARLLNDPNLSLGDVTTVNLTMMSGGVQQNVVPKEFTASFDVRIPPTVDFTKFEEKLRRWAEEAGEGVQLHFKQKGKPSSVSPHSMENPWWKAMMTVFDSLDCEVRASVFMGATDARYLRHKGIPCYGFSPMARTPVLLHDHNEYLDSSVYLEGIETYVKLIYALANVPDD